jgi:hypothetical protein
MTARLSKSCRSLLEKSQDSALQAVSIYNDPRSIFRTGNFTVLMSIAWTALIHSYFEKTKVNYFYKNDKGRYTYIDGEKAAWELSKSIKQIFSENDPVRKNLELFIKLRNKIEHRNLPALDQFVLGECQALVLNFESFLVNNFGRHNSIIDTMFIPIQLSSSKRSLPKSKLEESAIEFVKNYRNVLEANISTSQQYEFKAFLVPKIGNHRSSSDIAIEFVTYDESNAEEMDQYDKAIIAIKEKLIPIANADRYKPAQVIELIHSKTGQTKNMAWHTRMWKKYKVRPSSGSSNKHLCKTDYCVYDAPHGDYVYTEAWISLLVRSEVSSK